MADLPVEAILLAADELARRWVIALILARPLERIAEVPLEDLACEAPALCAQMVRALQSDVELDRLTGGGAPTGREQLAQAGRLAAIAGAHDASAAVEAVEALRGVLWETLIEQLRPASFDRSGARQVADLADRLAYVCAGALTTSIAATFASQDPSGEPDLEVAVTERSTHGGDPSPAYRRGAVIVDERRAGVRMRPERPASWDESPPVPPRAAAGEIAIRDERHEHGPSAWIGSIGRQLERFQQDGLRFAVLLVELLDIERLRRDEPPGEFSRLADRVEETLAGELRPSCGSLTRESPGRYWLLVAQTDRSGAERLAERLARAVQASRSHRSASLGVAVGTAICPEDGREPAALAAHADVGLYAARSAARARRSVAPR